MSGRRLVRAAREGNIEAGIRIGSAAGEKVFNRGELACLCVDGGLHLFDQRRLCIDGGLHLGNRAGLRGDGGGERVDALRARISEWDDEGKMLLRQYMKEAEILTLDGNGRFLIPKRYLQMAEIAQTVRFIGLTDTIEIWAAEKAEAPFMSQQDFAAKLKALMANQ